ncbi:MAG TPA: methyltransferase domain-containing protein [Isosphaeraceae bacterium]
MRLARAACTLTAWLIPAIPVLAQQIPAPPRDELQVKGATAHPPHRDSGKAYQGRPIADVMSYLGADWLIRGSREDEEQPEAMLDALKIAPGSTVADVGAGVGYTSVRLARRVGPRGTVLATDVQPQMIRMLSANLRAAGIRNVRPIQCTPTDPKLPEGQVDLALMVDVYHECSDPETTLRGLRRALKPGGRLVLVEFRGEDPEVPIKPEHKMTFAQVRREIEPQGFTFKEKFDFLPWQHIIVFEKPAADAVAPADAPAPPSRP